MVGGYLPSASSQTERSPETGQVREHSVGCGGRRADRLVPVASKRTAWRLIAASVVVLALLFFFFVPVLEVAVHCRNSAQLFDLCDLKRVTLFQKVFHLYRD